MVLLLPSADWRKIDSQLFATDLAFPVIFLFYQQLFNFKIQHLSLSCRNIVISNLKPCHRSLEQTYIHIRIILCYMHDFMLPFFYLTFVPTLFSTLCYQVCARIGFEDASVNHNRTGNCHPLTDSTYSLPRHLACQPSLVWKHAEKMSRFFLQQNTRNYFWYFHFT